MILSYIGDITHDLGIDLIAHTGRMLYDYANVNYIFIHVPHTLLRRGLMCNHPSVGINRMVQPLKSHYVLFFRGYTYNGPTFKDSLCVILWCFVHTT